MNDIDPDVRVRLLDGLPPLVQGMAEAILAEWHSAVDAVPELERLAGEDLERLVAMAPAQREGALRRRWSRLIDGGGLATVELEVQGRPAARREPATGPLPAPQPAMTTP